MAFAINNCRLDLEDREFLNALPEMPMQSAAWRAFVRPAAVDVTWHRTENQGQIGSCQGHALTSVLERVIFASSGGATKKQLSEIFAYLATQKIDGLLYSDNGSTITGGGKVGMEIGAPDDAVTGYPRSYPNRTTIAQILSPENYKLALENRAKALWRVSDVFEETLNFIGGGGGISFGISWYEGLIPRDRIVRAFEPNKYRVLGGHAMAVLGYTANGELLAANSHADGIYTITEKAWIQMVRARQTAAIGLRGDPKPEPIDWYNNSPYLHKKTTQAS